MKKQLLLGPAMAFVALWSLGCSRQETAKADEPPIEATGVQLATLSESPIQTTYEATGTLRAKLNATLSSKVMARVLAVNVREGDRVRAGQPLVALDSRELQAAVRMANANLNAASVGVSNAETAATIEVRTSVARVAQAREAINQVKAGLAAARSRLDLAQAGPRTQERTQAHLAVQLAESNLKLAQTEKDRVERLVTAGALAGRLLDSAQNALDVAQAQYASAIEAEKIAQEGTRSQDIRTAQEAVIQAGAAVRQAEANYKQALAAQLQTRVRQMEIQSAQANRTQAEAALGSSQVTLSYATVVAPFDGVVVSRSVDPGAMATPGAPLVSIEGAGLRLEATVPEGVLSKVKVGTTASVKLDALGAAWQAKVVEIVPQGDASTHSFLVKLAMPNDAALKAGMFGRASFTTGSQERILVPKSAVWEQEGLHYVYAVNGQDVARLRIVTLGREIGEQVEALSGLSNGDRIVVGGRENVVDGAKVRQ